MKPTTIKGEIVKEYLSRFPKAAHLTLAKKIQSETGILFDSVDQCRSLIRNYTGSMGEKGRKQLTDRRFMRTETVQSTNNKYDLPESDTLTYYPFKFPKAQNDILIVGDIHAPFHDIDAITATIDWAKEHKVNTVLLNGDVQDCHHLSSFVRDPRLRRFNEEREITWRLLDQIQNAMPNAVFYWKQGNHEERYERYLMVRAPEIFDTEEYQYDIIMRMGERAITYIGDKLLIKAGKLNIAHGHEFRGGSMVVNTAKWLFGKTKESALVNHFHNVSEHSEPTVSGDLITTWSTGCLCDLHPAYMPNNRWAHGFARVRVADNDNFKVYNARIQDGKVL